MCKKIFVLLLTLGLTISNTVVYADKNNEYINELDNMTTEDFFIEKENNDIKFKLDNDYELLENRNKSTSKEKLPDLRLYDIKVKEGEKYPFEAMKPARLTYVIANYGFVDASNIVIGLKINGKLVFKYKHRDVESGIGYISTIRLDNFSEGTWEIGLVADVDNTVRESNEVNNWDTRFFKWVKPSSKGTWYSQVAPNYNNNNLNDLFFPNIKPTIKNGQVISSNEDMRNTPLEWDHYDKGDYKAPGDKKCLKRGHINFWGCTVSSLAMVLNNLNAKTINKHYDFRTDSTSYLKPDPFTVTMANLDFPKITSKIIDSKTKYEVLDYTKDESPVFVYSKPGICSYFGYTSTDIKTEKYTEEEISDTLVKLLKEHPEGVCAKVNYHYIVIMNYIKEKINIEAGEEYENNFIICDPGTTQEEKGNNVKYKDSYTNGSKYLGGMENIKLITYLTKK